MKLLLLAALAALCVFAQDKTEKQSKPLERPLTHEETVESQYDFKSILLLAKQHNAEEHQKALNEYQKAVTPFQQSTWARVVAACKSVGVEEKDVQTKCGFTNGLDQDGKPMLDQNGKPVEPKVWKIPEAPKTAPPARN